MMRSLWSGVSGLQSHQVAMDVESHNIANVNTVGFKYSRANFSDQFSQTARPATAPEGELGGKNAMQIGLGTQIVSTQQIFSQGSIETTDSNTDMAIQGNGFFIVSPDGGLTRYYTRNGQFTRDSLGNFVDNNGYIVQGWMRDEETNTIDPTGPIKNIVIEPGLSIPANATTEINYKGNLNSGNEIGSQSSPIYSLDHHHGWVDKNGDGLINNNNELFGTTELGNSTENNENWAEFYTDKKGNVKMHEKGVDLGVIFNDKGSSLNLRENQGIWVSYADAKYTSGAITVDAQNGSNLNIDLNGVNIQGNVKTLGDIEALINAKQAQTGVSASIVNGNRLQLVNQNNTGTTENMKNIKLVANAGNNANAVGGLIFGGANQGQQAPTTGSATIITAYKYTYSKAAPDTATHEYNDATDRKVRTTEDLRRAMQTDARLYVNYNEGANGTTQILSAAGAAAVTAWKDNNGQFTQNATANRNDGVEVTINAQGQFSISNPAGDAWNEQDGNGGQNNNDTIDNRNPNPNQAAQNRNTDADDHTLTLTVTGFSSDTVNVNQKLTDVFSSISGSLTSGSSSTKVSSAIKMASHSMTTEIYDSLGTKHEVAIEFRKVEQTEENGTRWSMVIRVPEPAQINPDAPVYKNIITGEIRFKSDGSILGYQPSSITLTPNNGSSAGQTIALNFGTLGGFEGMRSYDAKSSTDNIAQDGYKGGTLNDLRIDENGKIIGSFTNGRSLALAQVGMATFTNNNGLENLGGNVFGETANSGTAVIGAANTGARGKISGSALEMSNVDLSRAFTQLIVVQRGYQANSKTITTSDTMLNTLLQLKQ